MFFMESSNGCTVESGRQAEASGVNREALVGIGESFGHRSPDTEEGGMAIPESRPLRASLGNARSLIAVGRVLFRVVVVAGFALFASRCGTNESAVTTPPPAPMPAPGPAPAPAPPPAPPPSPFVESAATVRHLVPLFPEGSNGSGREGFMRIVNHSEEDGPVRIAAFDNGGSGYQPVTLAIGAGRTVHLGPGDLTRGNPAKGVSGATGSGWGDGRLELSSDLDIMVLSYIRHQDGFLTSMHDIVPREGNRYYVRSFHPGSERNQTSRLRLINPDPEPATVRIRGIDDRGVSSGEATVSLPAGATREITAAELESGTGTNGSLGRGTGKWRLVLETEDHLVVLNLSENPTGYLANLSSVPRAGRSGAWTVPLFPRGSDLWGRQGLVRIINHSARGGAVRITTFDDSQRRYAPFTVPIGAGQAIHLDSDDLEAELSGGVGSGPGNVRLLVGSDLDIEVLSYIEHSDGLLTSTHDVAPLGGHRVATFMPGSGRDGGTRLRLINTGEQAAEVTVGAIDDRGESPGSAAEITVPARAAREFTAAELGFGGGAAGDPGDGPGAWRLIIDSEGAVEAMSLLESSAGHLANLSTEPRRDPVLVEDNFEETSVGNPAGIHVSVVDGQGFDPDEHGHRITATFLGDTRYASLVQIGGWGRYALNGASVLSTNARGYFRHALTRDRGIFWTATGASPAYFPGRPRWFVKDGRPFSAQIREFAYWMRDRDVLYIGSLENATCAVSGSDCFARYCDDFELNAEGRWIPMCGELGDYLAHSGVGSDIVVFAGALSGNTASGAIRADGVFAPHAIYVESRDGSTSHAAPVLAAYATNLAFANPSWSASRLKRELMALAREETVDYRTGGSRSGVGLTERRTVRAIRPRFAPMSAPRASVDGQRRP